MYSNHCNSQTVNKIFKTKSLVMKMKSALHNYILIVSFKNSLQLCTGAKLQKNPSLSNKLST